MLNLALVPRVVGPVGQAIGDVVGEDHAIYDLIIYDLLFSDARFQTLSRLSLWAHIPLKSEHCNVLSAATAQPSQHMGAGFFGWAVNS